MHKQLLNRILGHYRQEEFPALYAQATLWQSSQPLQGRHILDATPVYRNTLCKYLAILAGGARLSVYAPPSLPGDQTILAELPRYGIHVATADDLKQTYDVVCDCAGVLTNVPTRYGAVELTRSGAYAYENASFPVFMADAGKLKQIETSLGTGDGFLRAMTALGHGNLNGQSVVIFGGGKVGRGVALAAMRAGAGARVTLVDDTQRVSPLPGAALIDMNDREAIERTLSTAYCVVSTTGQRNALAHRFDAQSLIASSALIVNMGVEDEYGPGIPAERALNCKAPLNFILDEPTHLKYIDPTLALDNYGIIELIHQRLAPGINAPSAKLEESILATILQHGVIRNDLESLELLFSEY